MGIFLVIIFIILLFFGMPIGFLLGLLGICLMWQFNLPQILLTVPQRFFESLNTFTFLACPFFMLCGLTMARIGVSEKLLALADLLVGRTTGGIGNVNVVGSAFFGGISGSSLADIVGLGSIEIPMMVEAGYDPEYSTGITIASGILSVIIPPSVNLIIYGAIMDVSIGGLFAAGLPAGLLITTLLIITNVVISKKRNYPRREYKIDKNAAFKIIKESIPVLVLPIIILGGIYSGIVTPTEAGAVAAAYAFFLGFFLYRNLNLIEVSSIFMQTIKFMAIVGLLIGSTSILAWYLVIARVSSEVGAMLLSISENPYIVMLFINIILLLAGMFMDLTAALLILAPILAPIVIKMGFHPIHVGLVISLNLSIGMMTPPLGVGLFAGAIIGKVKFEDLVKSIFPLVCTNLISLFIITYCPIISMFLPKMLGYY